MVTDTEPWAFKAEEKGGKLKGIQSLGMFSKVNRKKPLLQGQEV